MATHGGAATVATRGGAATVPTRGEPTPGQSGRVGGKGRSGCNAAVRLKGREVGDDGGRLAGVRRVPGLGRMRMEGQ